MDKKKRNAIRNGCITGCCALIIFIISEYINYMVQGDNVNAVVHVAIIAGVYVVYFTILGIVTIVINRRKKF